MRKNKKGRAKGGVIVGVKKEIAFREASEWDYGVVIEGIKIGKKKEMNIIVVYNNGKIKEMLKKLKEVINRVEENRKQTLIIGDMNARIGDWQIGEDGEAKRGRKSMDKTVNYEGKKLIEFWEEMGGWIANGAVCGDWEGMYTHKGDSNESVLDLVIEIEDGREKLIKEMIVKPRIESDHFPVEMYIERKGTKERSGSKVPKNKKKTEEKLRWRDDKMEEYVRKMEEKKESIETTGTGAQEKWENMVKCIWETGRELKMVKKVGGEERAWGVEGFREVINQKKKTWKALRRWAKKREEKDKETLRFERKKLKEIRREKKREIMKEKWENLERSRTVEEFWKAINGFRKKRERITGGIKKEEWLRHFKQLLGEAKREDEGARETGRNEEANGEEGELNRKVTVSETGKALRKMKKGKAAGEDGLVGEFLKYLPGVWLTELTEIINRIFEGEELIKGWEVARICPIYKEGNEGEVKNYRGVALLDVGYKVFANILAGRLGKWMEEKEKIGESQAGFRKARDTRDHIFVLNSIIGGEVEEQ